MLVELILVAATITVVADYYLEKRDEKKFKERQRKCDELFDHYFRTGEWAEHEDNRNTD